MIIAYLVATFVATVLAAVNGPRFPDLPYWRRWDPGPVRAAIGVIWSLYAATGLAVTALADHMDWTLLDTGGGRDLANGAAYGAAAAALLRLEITSFGLSAISPARTIFNSTLKRLSGWLQAGADRRVPRVVGELRPQQLCRGSWRLALRYVRPRLAANDPQKAADHLQLLRGLHASARARDHDTGMSLPEAMEAQETLRFYIEELIILHRDSTIEFGQDDESQP